jgi:hypothetical protein
MFADHQSHARRVLRDQRDGFALVASKASVGMECRRGRHECLRHVAQEHL